ncbi:hypothetical protein CYMTET_2565 [Cymbomonas tetramitiformis]|uniref:Cyclic nucleotide-binding domain-containing protein n=1 Tax=Cymbomonas tetramitiformis TaxID=36881 RepID=A0AAE0LLP2_9CHLO|nr:hypothetical protein CYMTET_2565 [Cymbomonas tetramitiformis]
MASHPENISKSRAPKRVSKNVLRIYRVLTSAASGLRCKGELAPLLNFLEDVQGIARLSDSQKFNLVHAFALVEFEPNEYVCNVGDPTDTYFVCLDGKLEVSKPIPIARWEQMMSVANVKEETTAGEVASSRVTEEEDEIESQKSRFRRTARARHKTIVENRRQKLNASAGLQKMLKTAKKVVGMRMAMKQLGVHKPEVGAEATSEDATVGLASTQSSPLKAEPRDASSSSGDVVGGSNHSSPTPAGSGSVAENVTKNLCPADSLGEDAPVNSDVQKEGSLTVAPNADVIKTREAPVRRHDGDGEIEDDPGSAALLRALKCPGPDHTLLAQEVSKEDAIESHAQNPNRWEVQGVISGAQAFGEAGMVECGGRGERTATIRCSERCILLRVTKEDWLSVKEGRPVKALQPKFEFLRSSEVFRHLSHETLCCLQHPIKEVEVARSSFVFQEGETINKIYLIKSGTCLLQAKVDGKQRPMSGRIDLIRLGPVSFVGIVDAMRPPHTYTLSCQAKGSSVVLYEIPIADFLLWPKNVVEHLIRIADQRQDFVNSRLEKVRCRMENRLPLSLRSETSRVVPSTHSNSGNPGVHVNTVRERDAQAELSREGPLKGSKTPHLSPLPASFNSPDPDAASLPPTKDPFTHLSPPTCSKKFLSPPRSVHKPNNALDTSMDPYLRPALFTPFVIPFPQPHHHLELPSARSTLCALDRSHSPPPGTYGSPSAHMPQHLYHGGQNLEQRAPSERHPELVSSTSMPLIPSPFMAPSSGRERSVLSDHGHDKLGWSSGETPSSRVDAGRCEGTPGIPVKA